MARPIQPSLAGGELSPSCYARVDLARYAISLKTCKNWIIRPYGGAVNRPGTKYLAEVKTSAKKVRLIPFIVSTSQAYVVEVGDQYMRFYAGGAQILSGGVPYEIASPYLEADLENLRWTQSADVLTIVHPSYNPRELRRTSGTPTFAVALYENENGPFLDINGTTISVHASAKSGTGITLSASSAIFVSGHIGTLFYMESEDLSDVPPWEPSKRLAEGGANPLNVLRRSDGKIFKCITDYTVPSGGSCTTGTVRPTHEAGSEMDGDGNASATASKVGVEWEYQDSGYGICEITAIGGGGTTATANVLRQLPDNVVGGIVAGAGPWSYVGDGATTAYAITGATSSDRTDYTVLLDGVPKDTNGYTVNSVTDQLTFYNAPAVGVAISIRQNAQSNLTEIWAFGAWSADQGFPSSVAYYGERMVFGGTSAKPDTMWFSKTSNYTDHGKSTPLVDDDALKFTLAARQVNAIRDVVPLDSMLVLTAGGEWKLTGGQDDVITPSSIGAKPQSYRGSSTLGAKIIGNTAIYVQDRGSVVRDLAYSLDIDGYDGGDLTAFSDHLFDGYSVVDIDYQQVPFSILWCVRSDGVLLGLTYMREHQVIAWHRHETDGVVEHVCCIPEGSEDAVYLAVRRTVGGAAKRYVERMTSRRFADIKDAFFVDCGLSYDGRNTTSKTMAVSGSGWTIGDTLTMTASSSTFASGDVGDRLELTSGGETVRFDITGYTSTTIVSVRPLRNVPAALQFVATTSWTFMRDTMSGLAHLNGKTVAVLSDGNVEPQKVVSSGSITLEAPGGVVHVGLPITADLETLDLQDGSGDGRVIQKTVPRVDILVRDTRGIKIGPDLANLYASPVRLDEAYTETPELKNGRVEYLTSSTWNDTGRILIRQEDPLPAQVLGIIPEVKGGR